MGDFRKGRAADAIERLANLTDEAIGFIPEARMWQDFPADLGQMRGDILRAAALLRGEHRLDADQAGRSFAVITELITLANLSMEAIPGPDERGFADRYDRLLNAVIEAHSYFIEIADRLDLDIAGKWCRGYLDVIRANPSLTDLPKTEGERKSFIRRVPIARDERAMVWRKSGGRCWYCGVQTQPFENFCVDHFTPVADNGTNDLTNLVPSCHDCNAAKAAKHIESFRAARGGALFWFEIVRSDGR